jgi:threonine dehydratase
LHRLTGPARDWGLREISVKDERARLGLRSFKAIGGAYAVLRLSARALSSRQGGEIAIADMLRRPKPILPHATFTAATAGNHGCAVAAGARLVGARCRIFVADGVPSEQIDAIRAQGADIVCVSGSYEEGLRACSRGAGTNMGRLECYAPSAAAWPVLRVLASAYATVADADARAACGLLAHHDLATTPSGAAGLAALARIMALPEDRARLRLGPDSDVLVVVTEAPLRDAAG